MCRGPQTVRRAVESPSEIFDCADVMTCGIFANNYGAGVLPASFCDNLLQPFDERVILLDLLGQRCDLVQERSENVGDSRRQMQAATLRKSIRTDRKSTRLNSSHVSE